MITQRWLRGMCVGLCLAILAPVSGLARETSIPDRYPSTARSIRALGMGNAFLTMRGTRTMDMFYNPAMLNDLPHEWEFSVFGNDAGLNTKLISTVKDVFDLADGLDAAADDAGRIGTFRTFFNDHVGEFNSVDYALNLFSMGRHDWGFAVLADSKTTVSFRNRAFPNFELRSRNDGVVAAGRSLGLLYNDLVLGLLVKGMYRLEIDKVVTTGGILGSSLNGLIGFDQWGKSFGVGVDVGARYELPILGIRPVIGVTYQDIGGKQFFKNTVDDTPQSVNAAIGIHPSLGNGFELSVEAGATELNQRRDFLTRIHAGAELRFPRIAATQVSLRAGTNQGYVATGLSLDWPAATLDFAFYGEEQGFTTRVSPTYKLASAFAFYF